METNAAMSSSVNNSTMNNTKKSIRKVINMKKSSLLLQSVLSSSSSRPQDITKIKPIGKNEIINNNIKDRNLENIPIFNSQSNEVEKKLGKIGEGYSPELRSSLAMDFKMNFRLNNNNPQVTNGYASECDSLNLGMDKLSLNGDNISKFFCTNDNYIEEIKINTDGNGMRSLYGTDRFFLRDFKEGEYIFDDCIKIVNFIAEGAQARIFLGLIEEIDKYVAIKRMDVTYDKTLIERVEQECEMVKNLEHPNILKYFDIEISAENYEDEPDDAPPTMCKIDIIMEYIDGMNLKELILKEKTLSIEKIKFIMKKVLEGLVYLHENKIIHRDLKPENVLVNSDLSEIKIVDFGISTQVKEFETQMQRSVLGTPNYMAPEIILEKPYSYEVDIWSLGCILYELISGIKPYHDVNNPFNVMYKVAQYTSPLEYADDTIKDTFYDKSNRTVLDFLQKCWRPNNAFRPSATELLEHDFISE